MCERCNIIIEHHKRIEDMIRKHTEDRLIEFLADYMPKGYKIVFKDVQ